MNGKWISGFLTQVNAQGKRRKGDKARSTKTFPGATPGGPSAPRVLGRRARQGVRPSAAPGATIGQFLDTPGTADKAAADQIEAEMNKTGLPSQVDAEEARLKALQVDPRALGSADDVVLGLKLCPAAEKSGVGAKELAGDLAGRQALDRLDTRLVWVQGQVRTGKRVTEAWQRHFRAAMAAELLIELGAARTLDEYLAILTDAAEVLDMEAGDLAKIIQTRQENQAGREDLAGQIADENRDILFLQTWRDLGQRKQVPQGVLETMAQYYAQLSEEDGEEGPVAEQAPSPAAATITAPAPAPAPQRKRQRVSE